MAPFFYSPPESREGAGQFDPGSDAGAGTIVSFSFVWHGRWESKKEPKQNGAGRRVQWSSLSWSIRSGSSCTSRRRSGLLTAVRCGQGIELDFPAEREQPVTPPHGLREALGADILYVGRNRFDFLVQLPDADTLRNLRPDLRRLAEISARGIIVTSL